MRRTDVTYDQLDRVLRLLGFSCRPARHDPPGRVYEHKATGAMILLPAVGEREKVYEHHLEATRLELENFGLANRAVFAAQLQKTG